MTSALDGKPTPMVHEDRKRLGDFARVGRLDATSWDDFLLFLIPDGEVFVAGGNV